MPQIKLEQINAFLAVVQFGGIKKAADALHLTQPAVTTRIKSLEMALGLDLFERTKSGVRLTKRGWRLVSYAEQFQQLAQLVEADVMEPTGVERHLRLGASETITQSWLPDFVARLHAIFPNVEIEISVDISLNLKENLLNREIDLAILLGPISDYTVENIELPAFELAWYRAAPQNEECPDPVDFTTTPVISYARNTRPYRELRHALFSRFGPGISLFPSSSLSSCFRLVEAGLGVGALPRALGEDYVKKQKLVEFDPGWCPKALMFSASYVNDGHNHLLKSAALLAKDVAIQYGPFDDAQ